MAILKVAETIHLSMLEVKQYEDLEQDLKKHFDLHVQCTDMKCYIVDDEWPCKNDAYNWQNAINLMRNLHDDIIPNAKALLEFRVQYLHKLLKK